LEGVLRTNLKPGSSQNVTFTINPRDLSLITDDAQRIIEPGVFDISIGGKQPGFSGTADAPTTSVIKGQFTLTGQPVKLEL
jgi:beta-glucosidase